MTSPRMLPASNVCPRCKVCGRSCPGLTASDDCPDCNSPLNTKAGMGKTKTADVLAPRAEYMQNNVHNYASPLEPEVVYVDREVPSEDHVLSGGLRFAAVTGAIAMGIASSLIILVCVAFLYVICHNLPLH